MLCYCPSFRLFTVIDTVYMPLNNVCITVCVCVCVGVSDVTILQDNGHFFLLSHPPHTHNTHKRWSDNSMAGSDMDEQVQSDPETRSPHSSNE